MTDAHRRRIATNGVELDVLEAGTPGDPVVVLAHGFPESSHSWRHQIAPLAERGYHVLAPDQRGYAASSAPESVAAYRSDHLSNDLVGLLDDVGADDAFFVGHDWGAIVLWDLARFRPERVRGVVNVSVPYTPWPLPPTELFGSTYGDRFFYILYFQQIGPPEAELNGDPARFLRAILWAASADTFGPPPAELPPMEGTGFTEALSAATTIPDGLPSWISTDDFQAYVDQFTTSGFFGPLSWYRNLDADHELTKDLPAPAMPCAFIGGRQDPVIAHRPEYVESMNDLLPDFRGTIWIDDAGHWTQQEQPAAFNTALLDQLDRL
ncbi:MAG: alpha/beta hydrolase [Acidimicrobiia bacterium]|nr:alpha/beta hydrolase [Acidimicrobiia bacterium]